MRLLVSHGLEAVLTPTALEGPDLVAAADRHPVLGAILVDYHIIGSVLTKLALPAHRRKEPVSVRLDLALI
jgi:hypothetical protein